MAGSNVPQDGPVMSENEGRGEGHGRHPWHNHPHFTEAELRVIEECKRESLLYRALPLAAAFGALTFAAVTNGFLAPNAGLGAWPKVLVASFLGYSIGKMSYRKTYMKKMMALPDSSLGQFLRERRGGFGPWSFGMFGPGGCPRGMYWGAGPLPEKPTAPEQKDL